MARDPPLIEVTLGVTNFGPISVNKIKWDNFPWFLLDALWPVSIPAHLLYHFAVFPKGGRDNAVKDVFPMVIVLWHIIVVAVRAGRDHRDLSVGRSDGDHRRRCIREALTTRV